MTSTPARQPINASTKTRLRPPADVSPRPDSIFPLASLDLGGDRVNGALLLSRESDNCFSRKAEAGLRQQRLTLREDGGSESIQYMTSAFACEAKCPSAICSQCVKRLAVRFAEDEGKPLEEWAADSDRV